MTFKVTGDFRLDKVAEQLNYLKTHEVVIGFFGDEDPQLLTIVRANEFGAHIQPKKGEYLWIPNIKVLKPLGLEGKKPSEIRGLFIPKGKKVACVTDEAGNLQICFYLMKEVSIPARPFIRNAAKDNRNKYKRYITVGVKRIIEGRKTGKELLEELGRMGVADIQNSSRRVLHPNNAMVTRENKKAKSGKRDGSFDNPLRDTGELQKSVTYRIITRGKL